MSSIFKAQTKHSKGKGKARAPAQEGGDRVDVSANLENGNESDEGEEAVAKKDEVEKKDKRRKDKVLMLSSRGVTQRMRHLMHDLEVLLPHIKKDSKLDSKSSLHLLNELADLHSCNNTLYFEARRHEDLYLWLARSPNGPSVKCHVQNVHTMDELKMTGNCLRGSRGLVVFDGGWEKEEWGGLMKEMLTHVFSTPRTSRRVKPFIDHLLLFSLLDNKIWFRNFQLISKDPSVPHGPPVESLVEIGPRFVLTPIRIFEGSFGGPTLFANPEFVSPAAVRRGIKYEKGQKYGDRMEREGERRERGERRKGEVPVDELRRGEVFA